MTQVRRKHDLLGERDAPVDVCYGVHTVRAIEDVAITGVRIGCYPDLIAALAAVKQAAAATNVRFGLLDQSLGEAIVAACEKIRAGKLHDQFVVDVVQCGAGTSTNMNANEVIANRALEILGFQKGDYDVLNPNEYVNMSQSNNDVYPTLLPIAQKKGTLSTNYPK